MNQPATAWAAISHLSFDGDIYIGLAADADTAKAICADHADRVHDQLADWTETRADVWRADVVDSDYWYTVTEHVVQGAEVTASS